MRRTFFLALLLSALCAPAPLFAQSDPAVASRAKDYAIGIEDELKVFIWNEKDLTVAVKVRPDGKITVPLVNDIFVVGLTSEEVRQKIQEALTVFIREPVVTVIVESIRSYQVYFLGEVRKQGVIHFYRPTRILQGIAAAGGLTDYADKADVVLLREAAGVETRTAINYKRLLAGDPSQENIYLKAGDTLLFKQ